MFGDFYLENEKKEVDGGKEANSLLFLISTTLREKPQPILAGLGFLPLPHAWTPWSSTGTRSLRAQGDPSRGPPHVQLRLPPPPPAPLPTRSSPVAPPAVRPAMGTLLGLSLSSRLVKQQRARGGVELPLGSPCSQEFCLCPLFSSSVFQNLPPTPFFSFFFLINVSCISPLVSRHGWDSSESTQAMTNSVVSWCNVIVCVTNRL